MCAVHCEKGEVSVQALKEEGGSTVRVLLNGKMLLRLGLEAKAVWIEARECGRNEARRLSPPEKPCLRAVLGLILGYSHAFRLVEPTPERVKQAGSSEVPQDWMS